MNEEYKFTSDQLEKLSELDVDFFNPEYNEEDLTEKILFKLCQGDPSKASIIENEDVERCYNWHYKIRIKELNVMKIKIAELKEYQKKSKTN